MTNKWTLPIIPFSKNEKMIVGVSGGSDSLGLLVILLEYIPHAAKHLIVAHVNYGLRGRSSVLDENLVRCFSNKMNLPFKCLRLRQFKAKAQREKRSVQELAREIRYAFFQKLVQREGAWGAAVAHHIEDQAETVFDRFLRGAGPRGLSGLRRVQKLTFNNKLPPLKVWRPLLELTKEEIQRRLKTKHIQWREDRSNGDGKYRRNQIRNEILPFLKKWNPKLTESLAQLAEITAAEDMVMEGLLEHLDKKVKSRWNGCVYFCLSDAFIKYPVALQRRWVRRVAEKMNDQTRGFSFKRIEEILEVWRGSKQGPIDLGFALTAGRKGRQAYLRRKG